MLGSLLLITGLAATNDASLSVAPRCGSPPPNWVAAASPLARTQRVKNTIRLQDGRLSWNGDPLTETLARQFLELVNHLPNPQPLTVLNYSAQTPCEDVQRTRSLIQSVIQCGPGECLEMVFSRR